MTQPTPEDSARKSEVGRETQGSVEGDRYANNREGSATDRIQPQRDKSAAKEDAPSCDGENSNKGLSPKNIAIPEPMTRAERLAYWTLAITLLLALGTAVAAIATADMAASTRQLARLAEQQAHDTQDALEAARRQASAAELANKLASAPQVSVSNISLAMPSVNTKATASFNIFNVGRSPASELVTQARLRIFNPPQLPPILEPCKNCGKTLLFPSQGLDSNGLTLSGSMAAEELSEETVAQIKAGATHLYLIGRVDYLGAEKDRHKILLCYVLQPDRGTSAPCEDGNFAE